MSPEIIILGSFVVIVGYIFIRYSITNKKINKKALSKKDNPTKTIDKDKVELKATIAPKPDENFLKEEYMKSEREKFKRATQESIESERIKRDGEIKVKTREEEQKEREEKALEKKLKEMEERIDEIIFTPEEQSFVDEVKDLSPELKAVLFADILSRKGF